jgi:hypothetical protein
MDGIHDAQWGVRNMLIGNIFLVRLRGLGRNNRIAATASKGTHSSPFVSCLASTEVIE